MTDLNPNVDVIGPSGRPARVVEETTQDDVVRQYLRVPMRDGVELAGLIFYPADGEPRPALIMRTPYGVRGGLTPMDELGFTTAKAGYAILIQDVRGSHDSDGIFALAENDRADVAVVGYSSEKWGERPKAYVLLRPGHDADEDAIRNHARARIAGFKVPDYVVFLDQLPRTATGKITKASLRARSDVPSR